MPEPFDELRRLAAQIQQLLMRFSEVARDEVVPNRQLYNPMVIDAIASELLTANNSVRKLDLLAHSEFGGKSSENKTSVDRVSTSLGTITFATGSPRQEQSPQVGMDPLIPQQPYTVGQTPLAILPPWDAPTFDPGPPETRHRQPGYKPRHKREED